MWLLNASRCFHASATWWKSPNENGLLVMSAVVALRRCEDEPEDRRDEEDGERQEDREPHAEPEHADPHQSSVLKSPLRVTISTAPTRPITSRSTAIAAAPLKSAYRKAS